MTPPTTPPTNPPARHGEKMNRFIIWVNKYRYAYFYKSQPSRKKIKHRDGRSSFTSSSKPISMQVSSLSTVEKSVGGHALENFLQLSALAYKHTVSLCAFMFIQIFASGTSRPKYSLCKFNLRGVTSNRRLFCVRAGRVRLRMDLLGYYQSTKEWWESFGPSNYALFTLLFSPSWSIFIILLEFWCIYAGWIGIPSLPDVFFFFPNVHFCCFTSTYFSFLSVSVCVKVMASLFPSRESCGKSQIYWQIGLQDVYTTEPLSPNTGPHLGAADLCVTEWEALQEWRGMYARLCLFFFCQHI